MGKHTTPRYSLEIGGFLNHAVTASAWQGKIPTIAALERYVMAGVVMTMPGFINETIGYTFGIQIPSYARIRQNKPGGRVMVEWKAPMFMALPDPKDFPELMTMDKFWADAKEHLERTGQDGAYDRRRAAYEAKIEALKTKGLRTSEQLSKADHRSASVVADPPMSEPHKVSDPNTPEAQAASAEYWEKRSKLKPVKS